MLFAMFFLRFTSSFQSDGTSLERGDKSDESKAQSNILLMQNTKFCASLKKIIFNSGVCSHYWWQYCHHRGHHAWTGQGFMILMDERRWLFWQMIVVTDYWMGRILKVWRVLFLKTFWTFCPIRGMHPIMHPISHLWTKKLFIST